VQPHNLSPSGLFCVTRKIATRSSSTRYMYHHFLNKFFYSILICVFSRYHDIMTECRRKTISISPTTLPFGQPTTPRLPKATSHPSPDSPLHLTECPFHLRSSIVGNTFLFDTNVTTPKKKLSDSSILFSPEKRAKREVPLHESNKQNMALS